jgi:hypothetical protein
LEGWKKWKDGKNGSKIVVFVHFCVSPSFALPSPFFSTLPSLLYSSLPPFFLLFSYDKGVGDGWESGWIM